jgi:hypothetical protein
MENPILYKENVEVVLGDAHDTCEALRSALWNSNVFVFCWVVSIVDDEL